MKILLKPNPLETKQTRLTVAPTQGARRATGVGATAGDQRELEISPPPFRVIPSEARDLHTPPLPCHPERSEGSAPPFRVMPSEARDLHTPPSVSSRAKRGICTPPFRVMPSEARDLHTPLPCHPERSEGSAVGNTAGNGGRLEEIPRHFVPRDDNKGGVSG